MTLDHVTIDRDNAVATIALPASDQGYLTDGIVTYLTEGVRAAQGHPAVRAICLTGQPGAFLLGADVEFFIRSIEANDLEPVLNFTRAAHELLRLIASSDKPIVAWVRGPALGAGLELALACHRIAASPAAKFAFPETGLGIYPGMGGTQRAPRRIGKALAKWMIYTGAIVPADQALEIGLVDTVDSAATMPHEVVRAVLGAENKATLTPRVRFRVLEKLFGENNLAALADRAFPAPVDPQAVRALVQLRGKAPIALRLAEAIIDRGAELPLDAAIEEEFAHLSEVFSTQDARSGLLSLGKQRPEFVGR